MKRWGVGVNNYYFTGSIILEEAPWYIFLIEYSIHFICHWIPRIPLSKHIKIIREGEEYTLRDYYGTTGDLFHIYICSPIFEWCWNRIKWQTISFPYTMLKEQFPDRFEDENEYLDKDSDEEEKKNVKDNLEYSTKIGDEFKIVYDKLSNISTVRMKKLHYI
jgi:hypothetical protein